VHSHIYPNAYVKSSASPLASGSLGPFFALVSQVFNRIPPLSLSEDFHGINIFEGGNAARRSSGSFEVAARSGNRNGLVHNPFTNTKVSIDPASELFVLTSDSIGFETVF
jgi:hypothetical protein